MAIAMIGSIVATETHSTWGASWWLRRLIFVSFQEFMFVMFACCNGYAASCISLFKEKERI
jgi:hypothetical protein